jgi:transcriptional regulator
MYSLPNFKAKDPLKIIAFMREHPFAMLCGADQQGRPTATQVPVFIDQRDGALYLSGHIMRNTDHHIAFENNKQVLAIFTGAHAYVSASWYEDPKQASTWNYMSVHARGSLSFTDETALITILKRTTDHFENDPDSTAGFDQLHPEYVSRLSKAIVAFEILVEEVDHVFKLSQNRDDVSYQQIIKKLSQGDENAKRIAEEMKKLRQFT